MFGLTIWDLLGIMSIICLLVSFSIGKNAIWGGLTLGALISLIILLIDFFGIGKAQWTFKPMIIGTLAGTFFELLFIITKLRQGTNTKQ